METLSVLRFAGRERSRVLVQTDPIADDGRTRPFGPIEALFKGRHIDGQIIILCVSWYTSFKLSLRDLVIHAGGPRHHADAHNDPAMGPTLPARIREALESICPSGWWILEDGRDIYKGWGQVGVPVSGRGQGRTDSGFLPEPKPRCARCQDLSPQCDEQQAHTHQDH